MGGDKRLRVISCIIQLISIHTSVWEVTDSQREVRNYIRNFNPHLRMGGDIYFRGELRADKIFQSTPPYGR